MEDQLKQYLQEFVETLKQGGQFAQEQLPLFVKEYLSWGFWESFILAITFLLAFLIFGKMAHYLINKAINYQPASYLDDGSIPLWIGGLISLILSGLFIGYFIDSTLLAIKITVAPRVYLIENLMQLIS